MQIYQEERDIYWKCSANTKIQEEQTLINSYRQWKDLELENIVQNQY